MQPCKYCKNMFEPKYPGQEYCCRHCSGSATAENNEKRYKKSSGASTPMELLRSKADIHPPKKNCFAWDADKEECIALNRLECLYTAHCPFFKTKKQAERDRLKALRRLKNK